MASPESKIRPRHGEDNLLNALPALLIKEPQLKSLKE